MKEEENKEEFQFPKSLDPTRDKYDPELDKYKDVVLFPEQLERANELLEKHPVPQWILDL